jgi:uracil-DNA glycosylase
VNAILCLKPGGMQAKVKPEWFSNCRSRFLKPTIEIVQPKVLVTLGETAYRATCATYDLKTIKFRAAVETISGFLLSSRTILMPVYHCGGLLNTHRPLESRSLIWRKTGVVLRTDH